MNKKFLVIALSFLLSGCLLQKNPETIKKELSEKWNFVAGSVTKSPIKGLYEVYANGEIFYVDEQLRYSIKGHLFSKTNNENITLSRLGELYHTDISKLPKDQALKVVMGKGTREAYLFVDPRSQSSLQLTKLITRIDDVTVYTYLTPLLGNESVEMTKNILCSSNPFQTWIDWVMKGTTPNKVLKCLNNTAQKNVALSETLGLKGVPNVIFKDGSKLMGTVNLRVLNERLSKAHQLSNSYKTVKQP